jgi:hypothetical protein
MNDFSEVEGKFAPLFQELAEMINQQPVETRERTRLLIGEYFHDIKHTLGLITGANTVLQRDLQDGCENFDGTEMIQIANDAAMKINQYIDLLTKNLTTLIDADVIK